MEECSGILAVRCMRKYDDAEMVKGVVRSVSNTNRDHHLLFGQIGEKIGFIDENIVRDAFLATWCEKYEEEVKQFIERIKKDLPCSKKE